MKSLFEHITESAQISTKYLNKAENRLVDALLLVGSILTPLTLVAITLVSISGEALNEYAWIKISLVWVVGLLTLSLLSALFAKVHELNYWEKLVKNDKLDYEFFRNSPNTKSKEYTERIQRHTRVSFNKTNRAPLWISVATLCASLSIITVSLSIFILR
jgi:hypothetical protein